MRIITGTRPGVEHKTFTHAVVEDYITTDKAEGEMRAWIIRNNSIPAEAVRTVTQDPEHHEEIWKWEWWEITL